MAKYWLLGLDADGDCRWRVVVAFAFVFVVVFALLRRPYSRLKRKPEVTYSKEAARTTRPAIAIASHSPLYSPLTKLCGKVSKTDANCEYKTFDEFNNLVNLP